MTLWKIKPIKVMCNAYIHNLMVTCNAYKYFAEVTRRMITHVCCLQVTYIFPCEAFLITVILMTLLFTVINCCYQENFIILCLLVLEEKHFTSAGCRYVCFQVKQSVLLLKHHLSHLHPSLLALQ